MNETKYDDKDLADLLGHQLTVQLASGEAITGTLMIAEHVGGTVRPSSMNWKLVDPSGTTVEMFARFHVKDISKVSSQPIVALAQLPEQRQLLYMHTEDFEGWKCPTPGCDCTKVMLAVNCHPEAPLLVSFEKNDGSLRLECSTCGRPYRPIKVATRNPQPGVTN